MAASTWASFQAYKIMWMVLVRRLLESVLMAVIFVVIATGLLALSQLAIYGRVKW